MRFLLVSLPLLLRVAGELPPEPVAHLTPPPTQPLVRATRNDSSNIQGAEPLHQEARALVWAAPAIPLLPSHRGRTSDCNPCDSVPWVPVARALHTPQYALSIPAIQFALPVNYGIPLAQMRPQSQYKASQDYGPPLQHQQGSSTSQNYEYPPSAPSQKYGLPTPSVSSHNYGPPPSSPSQNYGPPFAASFQKYGPPSLPAQSYNPPPPHAQNYDSSPSGPSQKYGTPSAPAQNFGSHSPVPSQSYSPPPSAPPQKYGAPPSQSAPPEELGSPSSGPAESDHKSSPPNRHGTEDDKQGLPPPPLPQRFLSPTYGPPQPQTQLTSATSTIPIGNKVLPKPAPFTPSHQLLPSVKFGPPFDPKQPMNQNIFRYPPALDNVRAQSQQYRDESGKRPVFVQNPVHFPPVTKSQLPPLFNYQIFSDGKQEDIHPYLQPPKAQNVVFTITETEDSCKKCKAQGQLKDSEPSPAEHGTESVVKTATQTDVKSSDQQNSNVQVMKSVPLAEYLASVEYPMQVIQAPILDVPELSKYFDIGYHSFPQMNNLHLKPAYVTSQTYGQPIPPHPHNSHTNSHRLNGANYEKTPTTALDDVSLSDYHDQTTNSLPHNHKPNVNVLLNHQTSVKGSTTPQYYQTTPFYTTTTTKPSQILHISKTRPSSQTEIAKQSTDVLSSSSTSGHFVTSQPLASTKVTTTSSTPLLEPAHSSSQNYHSTVTTAGRSPTGTSNLRPLDNSATRDWTYGRVWGNTPQPFGVDTSSSQKPRFLVRPTPTTKKAKHIHQIIVPYTTNKQPPAGQDSTNSLGWTPLPPTNQARKVPPDFTFEDPLPSSTGGDQLQHYQNVFAPGGSPTGPNNPFKSLNSESEEPHPIFPTSNGQPLNLPPQVINHILHLNQQGSFWPSGPEGLQQLLVTNLQGLLRGEEDSIDITRLQKNIDNWTAEGYKQNSPSVNYTPVTAIPHIFHSKKIPDEYLTSTETTLTNSSHQSFYHHNSDFDHDFAGSQKLQIKVHPLAHAKNQEQPQDSSASIGSLLNSWSLLDTKVTTSHSPATEDTTTLSTEPTSKAWEKTQVSISPLTNEKVYVVTPVPALEESPTSLQSTREKQTYSAVRK